MPTAYLRICDACCDNAGTNKEVFKTGGCTCDICGWACKCAGDDCKQFINKVQAKHIPSAGWSYLQHKNAQANIPFDWEEVFKLAREEEEDDGNT